MKRYLYTVVNTLRRLQTHPFQEISITAPVGDCCGTGGDHAGTYNISTTVALVAASGGLTIAKHGNRRSSSLSGSADVLEALGYPLHTSPVEAIEQLKSSNFCFMFAQNHYPALKMIHVIRKILRIKTIFNLIGPLLHPLQLDYQLIGVYDKKSCLPMIETVKKLKVKRALVIHGSGLDELAVHGCSEGYYLSNDSITPFSITPEEVGLMKHPLEALKGSTAEQNAKAMVELFSGKRNLAYLDAVALNAGALFFLAGKTNSIKEGVTLAKHLVESKQTLNHFLSILEDKHVT